jgi:uncharacterized OB-fold protein
LIEKVNQHMTNETNTYQFSGYGELYSYTLLQDPPSGYEWQSPYVIALIKLEEGPMVLAQLTDLDGEPQIGDRVQMVTRKLTTDGATGMIVYGYKFRAIR